MGADQSTENQPVKSICIVAKRPAEVLTAGRAVADAPAVSREPAMLTGDRSEHFAAPCTTETADAIGDLRRISAGVDVGTSDAGLETTSSDAIATHCAVKDLAGIEVICFLLRQNPRNRLAAQLVEKGDEYLYW